MIETCRLNSLRLEKIGLNSLMICTAVDDPQNLIPTKIWRNELYWKTQKISANNWTESKIEKQALKNTVMHMWCIKNGLKSLRLVIFITCQFTTYQCWFCICLCLPCPANCSLPGKCLSKRMWGKFAQDLKFCKISKQKLMKIVDQIN